MEGHRKGVVLAGGNGSRLAPLTQTFSKQLLPVYDKPMIYYPLATLMLAGIRDILLITTARDVGLFRQLLGDGTRWGLRIDYAVQDRPRGVAEALLIAAPFVGTRPFALILGDNLFYGHDLARELQSAAEHTQEATTFAYRVRDPRAYGVVELDQEGRPIAIEEKPEVPRSPYAIPGLYFFDHRAVAVARDLVPSRRGELEITDVLRWYLAHGALRVHALGRGTAWLDSGTPESLLQASLFIQTIEERQGLKIACPEEVAYRMGYVGRSQLERLAQNYGGSSYGDYLRQIAAEGDARQSAGDPRRVAG